MMLDVASPLPQQQAGYAHEFSRILLTEPEDIQNPVCGNINYFQ
jgi:hypothetical protein